MKSIFNKAKMGTHAGGRPPAAVELSAEGVLAAALVSGDRPAYAFAQLRPGTLIPGIAEPNIRAAEEVTAAIRSALGQVATRSRFVTLVLPDTAVRIFMLDFDALPARAAEALPVLRFRLRKMVPFEVEHAGVSYQILTPSKTELKVLTAVIPAPVLAEYEAVVRAAGYEPGAILPSSLAALDAIDSMEAVLTANLSQNALTTSIATGYDLLLHRTLDLPEDAAERITEIQRGIAVAAAYFEDKLQAPARTLHYAGCYDIAEFAGWIDAPELTVIDLTPRPETGLTTALGHANIAGAAGALAGAS